MRQKSSSALSRMNNKFADTDVDNVTASSKQTRNNGIGLFNSSKAAMSSVLEETPEFTRNRGARRRFMDDAAVLDDIKV